MSFDNALKHSYSVLCCYWAILSRPLIKSALTMFTHSLLAPAIAALPLFSAIIPQVVGSPVSADLVNTLRNDISERALPSILPDTPISSLDEVKSVIQGIETDFKEAAEVFATYAGLFKAVANLTFPDSIEGAIQEANEVFGNATNGIAAESVAQALLDGLSLQDLEQNVIGGYIGPVNSYDNFNNPEPPYNVYPKSNSDAPYNTPETNLRAAVYFPPGFGYGKNGKQPILFVPGTGAFGGVNFDSNLAKLLSATGQFDPVYLNVPGAMYNDTQVNAEYIAYAMNYVYAVSCNEQIAVISWSQGGPDTQWAYQYWPSTRSTTTDFIATSPDFHGTVNAYFLAPGFPDIPNPPSIWQQEYDSKFISTLRAGGGDSAYVDSTSIWSITDEIVQPQYNPVASAAFAENANCPAVSATNNQIQTVCQGRPGGGLYTHEGVLYNPLTFALAYDALTHPGPGQISRLDLNKICNELVAPGLSLEDVLATEGLIPLAALNYLLYPDKVFAEPAVMAYAQNKPVSKDCAAPKISGSCGKNSTGTDTGNDWNTWSGRANTASSSEKRSNTNQLLGNSNIKPIDLDSIASGSLPKRSNSLHNLGASPISPIDLSELHERDGLGSA